MNIVLFTTKAEKQSVRLALIVVLANIIGWLLGIAIANLLAVRYSYNKSLGYVALA